jgi:GGDEF-like domain/PucR C-terminal helix-turn-helix domain
MRGLEDRERVQSAMSRAGSGLALRLRERRAEIEQALNARLHAISDPSEVDDPEYALGLREAASDGLEYAFAAIESAHLESFAPLPESLRAQARSAAHNGVRLDTVLRRYSAGYSLLGDHLIQIGHEESVSADELKAALRLLSAVFDRLLDAISTEYERASERRPHSTARRRAEEVRKLLDGASLDPAELPYDLSAWHLATIASGPGAAAAVRGLAATLGRNLLLVQPADTVWAWLGGRSRLSARELLRLSERSLPAEVSIAVGEPGAGMEGWRLSHRQAKAAMAVMRRSSKRRVRYADVALLASALRDEVLAASLREIYLVPLEGERDGGAALRRTLEAYFDVGRKASLAAAALGVSRKTVSIRLRSIGERIGRPVDRCATELETALRLRSLQAARGLERPAGGLQP